MLNKFLILFFLLSIPAQADIKLYLSPNEGARKLTIKLTGEAKDSLGYPVIKDNLNTEVVLTPGMLNRSQDIKIPSTIEWVKLQIEGTVAGYTGGSSCSLEKSVLNGKNEIKHYNIVLRGGSSLSFSPFTCQINIENM